MPTQAIAQMPGADHHHAGLNHLATPCLVLDRQRLDANIEDMAQRLAALGVAFRPHAKTHKCIEVATRMEKAAGFSGLTVSTLREAEFFAAAGFRDLLYGVSISPDKFARASALLAAGIKLTLVLDTEEVCERLLNCLADAKLRARVMIEIDADGHRAGLEPDDPTLLRIATQLTASPYSDFAGIMVHAGESYGCYGADAIAAHAERERAAAVAAAQMLRDADIEVPVVSIGSTPTARFARDLSGITEARPGVFAFYDLVMAGIGACDRNEIALTVLTTVISHKPSHRRLIIDAGGLALSKDRGTATQREDCGFGLIVSSDGARVYEGLCVNRANQEHGIIELPKHYELEEFPIGSRLRVLPNHACMTAAAHDGYQVVEGCEATGEYWQRCNGW
ncbi:MAG: alanine racemase [Halieaceae bacterium]|jgi:D-serine deaminase-like pyridoxal phosphate-dependent protein|nr:alanine racemase [Halieaceae bacterium]